MIITSDFTKLIKSVVRTHKLTDAKIFRDIESDLSVMAFELFKRLVVFDGGSQKQDALSFIMECLYPIMTKDETRGFVFKIIEEFLTQPHSNFSQISVHNALNTLGIPEGELISFMVAKMNIRDTTKELIPSTKIQPFVFMSSVLMLALESLKKISVPEPGQALHKGVSCSSCHAKHIVGWRYKCGHCPGDKDFDEKCVSNHLAAHPDHVMLIIQEPLPSLTS